MKFLVAGLAVFVGLSSVAYSQNNLPAPDERPVHPGTALLDSMEIYAGAPDPAEQRDSHASRSDAALLAFPTSTADKQP